MPHPEVVYVAAGVACIADGIVWAETGSRDPPSGSREPPRGRVIRPRGYPAIIRRVAATTIEFDPEVPLWPKFSYSNDYSFQSVTVA